MRETLCGYGLGGWLVDMLEEYAQAYAAGWGDLTTSAVTELLGRSPRDLADFLRGHAGHFSLGGLRTADPTVG
ncbi:hypothetical protein JQS43_13020 [Natronosporangium hydrolyticum]|uniref:Uncharacterized protein n=1 Tax=Natronosporangium hydrolyticum TaxID=2811111 RepID=A0A895YEI1_9ACTN|nr:hypothetical protein [Natronosporangium hydrolyticum]QSB12630.1 hypothetical protein JQS43_13020 [Natronosporangium hydrolyticum]